ncbi:hypothetical protein SUGI_0201910 [Cryptomeria japonica]|nr:hypothetical protein SUGI_0201910 [Cryptomeria japonica]
MNVAPPEGLFSSTKVDVEIAKSAEKKESAPLKDNVSKIWVTGYLGDIGSSLRSAGWKEDEISDMINPPASYIQLFKGSERQNFMESLAYHVDLLSLSLGKAGWSAKDIFESLNFHSKQRKIPPQRAAKVGQIAEYLPKAGTDSEYLANT